MKTILVVEDESALQKALSDVLAQEGFGVISALDGEAGLRLAQEKKPGLILLDLILPKMNGLEVLEALKKDGATKQIPVIVLTNLEDMKNIQKAVDLGATTYLVKANYSLEEVLEKVRNTIG
ncbi:MAG: response regulator [Candidatus Wildermuthbacteria bacterium]|nr:response regulator [Candidatus Wildermuthbacteria bacterium]